MKIAIFGKSLNDYNAKPIQRLISKLENSGVELMVNTHFFDLIKGRIFFQNPILTYADERVLAMKPDYFCSIGGDGTMLSTVTFVGKSGVPIIGVNTGRLGFLSGIAIDTIEESLDQILAGKIEIDKRSMVMLETQNDLFGSQNFALNEISVHRKDTSAMITIHTFLNGEFMNSYWADGLIISTPTGSTAYSLSCGGPVVMPDSENFIVTPISPHNLNVRPMIISDKDILTLRVEGRNKQFLISLDSRSDSFEANIELTIRKAPFEVKLVRLKGDAFLTTLRQKLMWGIDKRN
jgi:NAD+ kinase